MLTDELLQRFKRGEVVFHTPTQEIFEKTMERVKEAGCDCNGSLKYAFKNFKEFTGIDNEGKTVVTYSPISYYRKEYPQLEIITLTIDDFSEPSEITSVSVITSPGTAVNYTKAKVTKNNDGYTVEVIREPKFSLGEVVVHGTSLEKIVGISAKFAGEQLYSTVDSAGTYRADNYERYLRKLSDVLEEFK